LQIRLIDAEMEKLRGLRHEHIARYLGTEIEGSVVHIFIEYDLSSVPHITAIPVSSLRICPHP
jgi:hypothetical protein